MAVSMQSIKAHSSGRRARVHGLVGVTDGTSCHGCNLFEVVPTRLITSPWRYWCDTCHCFIDPFAVDCPREGGPVVEPPSPAPDSECVIPGGEVGGWIATRLAELGMEPAELAFKIGVKSYTVSRWLYEGVVPNKASLRKIESVLGRFTLAE